MAVAKGYFDFSASGFGCQVRLPRRAVASQKGRCLISVMVFVDKFCDFVCKTCDTIKAWRISENIRRLRGRRGYRCATRKGIG